MTDRNGNHMVPNTNRKSLRDWSRAIASLAAAAFAAVATPAMAETLNPLLPRNLSPWGMFLNADIVVKAVMIGLALASLLTWTVWLGKTIELGAAQRVARRRLKKLEGSEPRRGGA